MEIKKTKNYDVLDLAKFVFAIFIVALHSELLPNVLLPWLRLAVPMFFLISSFLFFSRIANLPKEKKTGALIKTIKRNLILYGIWFVILLPITLHVNEVLIAKGVLKFIFAMVKGFFLGSTWLGSWFIMANIISISLVFLFGKKCNNLSLLLITGALNIVCCLFSSYDSIAFINDIKSVITPITGGIHNNFVVALFWGALGKAFADKSIRLAKGKALLFTLCSCVLLFGERFLIMKLLNTAGRNDCFLMLIPTCLFLFAFLLQFENIKIKNAKLLRNMSTLIYVMHYAVIICLAKFYSFFGSFRFFAYFSGALLVSLIAGFLIIKLSELKPFKFLKYLY